MPLNLALLSEEERTERLALRKAAKVCTLGEAGKGGKGRGVAAGGRGGEGGGGGLQRRQVRPPLRQAQGALQEYLI